MALDPYESIQSEIAHLKKSSLNPSINQRLLSVLKLLGIVVVLSLIGLYFMDPLVYVLEKRQAFRVYPYLKNFGSPVSLQRLISTGIFDAKEIHILDLNRDDPRKYFKSVSDAEESSNKIIDYMNDLQAMKTGDLKNASPLARFRYQLFSSVHLKTPQPWQWLSPHPVHSTGLFN